MEYLNLPDMKGLATLKAVVEHGGVEQAGRILNVGQPAITKRLRALDRCYGIELMRREGRRLELTRAGERVYDYARLVLDHQSSVVDDLKQLHTGQTQLRLEVSFSIGEHLLPEQLLNFADAYPQYRLQSLMGYSRRIQRRLATGLSDMALLEQAPDHPDILVQKWLDDELLLVCGREHPLANSELLPLAQLSSLDYVLREPRSSMRIVLDKALAEVGVQALRVAMEVGSTDTIVEMLGRGKHVSFLPRFALREALSSGELVHLQVDGLHIKQTLWIARSRANLNNPVAEAFIQILREHDSLSATETSAQTAA